MRQPSATVVETDFYNRPMRSYRVTPEKLVPMTITYQPERLADIMDEWQALLPLHWEELSVTKEHYPLDPDYAAYLRMEEQGILHVLTARDGKDLIGYVIAMVIPSLHYRTCMMAVEDVYYLLPQYRKGRTGIKLFQSFEKRMRELKVNRIVITTKVHLDNSSLFEYLGYRFFEKGYTKMLEV